MTSALRRRHLVALLLGAAALATLMTGACVHEGPMQKAGAQKPVHVVFLVHGLAGTLQDFGHMRTALLKHLPGERDDVQWRVRSFEYDTGSNHKSVRLFARQLGAFVDATFKELRPNGLLDDDKFSLVAHSQGGLVSTTLLYDLASHSELVPTRLLPHVDSFVTLATPFWGAKTATFGMPIDHATNQVLDVLPGEKQLVDMSFGSDAIHDFRAAAMTLHQAKAPFPARTLNLIGYLKGARFAAGVSEGKAEFENDIAVLLPSGRLDFLFLDDTTAGYANMAVSSGMTETDFSNYTVVNAVHFSVPEVDSVVRVNTDCVDDKACEHPTFAYVLRHLAHKTNPLDDTDLKKMTGFLLDVEVELPDNHVHDDDDDVEVRFDNLPDGVSVGRLLEPYSDNAAVGKQQAQHRFTFTGTVEGLYDDDTKRFRDQPLHFSVHSKGQKSRLVHVMVRPTWSSYVRLRLEPAQAAQAGDAAAAETP